MRPVSIVGIGQAPVRKQHGENLRSLGAKVVCAAMKDAGIHEVDGLFCGNMLGDELQGQKHLGALITDEAGLPGIEALDVRAAPPPPVLPRCAWLTWWSPAAKPTALSRWAWKK